MSSQSRLDRPRVEDSRARALPSFFGLMAYRDAGRQLSRIPQPQPGWVGLATNADISPSPSRSWAIGSTGAQSGRQAGGPGGPGGGGVVGGVGPEVGAVG